jgi:hypothetical protein
MLWMDLYGQKENDFLNYLNKNRELIALNAINEYKLFDKSFYENQFFLLGEFHGTKMSYSITFELLQKIKQKTNIRYFIAELDNSSATFINEYLKTGDTAILDSVFYRYKRTFYYSVEYRQIFLKIRQLNETLPASQKISIVGVDIQNQPLIALQHIRQLIKRKAYKPGTFLMLDSFINKISQPNYSLLLQPLYADAKAILSEVAVNEKEYKAVFKDDLSTLHYTFSNICNWAHVYMNRNNFDKLRDSIMADNFKILIKTLDTKKGRFFGFFGREHVFHTATKENKWFTSRFKSDEFIPDGIASIILFYTGCEQMLPAQRTKKANDTTVLYTIQKFINYDGPFIKTKGIEILKKAAYPGESGVTLFRLNSSQSPFSTSAVLITNPLPEKKTTDHFQYAILIKGSPATIPVTNK